MNKRHFEILKEMIIDFNEYSTDYTKTKCKELEQVLTDTLDYINQLQSNWNSLREWLKEFKEYEKSEFQTNAEFYITVEEVLDKMNELEGRDKNEIDLLFKRNS